MWRSRRRSSTSLNTSVWAGGDCICLGLTTPSDLVRVVSEPDPQKIKKEGLVNWLLFDFLRVWFRDYGKGGKDVGGEGVWVWGWV